ncbi:hypothetical protein NL676_029590 [Syzygium grande]|nr:hypothetical protein NL676_029590 [Syzygium grande]
MGERGSWGGGGKPVATGMARSQGMKQAGHDHVEPLQTRVASYSHHKQKGGMVGKAMVGHGRYAMMKRACGTRLTPRYNRAWRAAELGMSRG